MPGAEHRMITNEAISLLPPWQRTILQPERSNLEETYCLYPDMYLDVAGKGHAQAEPYAFHFDGIPFHYLPDTPVSPLYRNYRPDATGTALEAPPHVPNDHWRCVSAAFSHYISHAVTAIQSGNLRDGCAWLGWLLHVLQDYAFGLHSLEGPNGVDCFVLDRLFPEARSHAELPSHIVAKQLAFLPDSAASHLPQLLGETIPEVVFHLFTRHAHTAYSARRLCHAAAVAALHNATDIDTAALRGEMSARAVVLSADVIFTALCIATRRFGDYGEGLRSVFLSDMEPVERPWGTSHYGFITMLRDSALGADKTPAPLELRLDGGKQIFRKGMGLGAHIDLRLAYEIPRGVYETFSCTLGLYPGCGGGTIDAQIWNDGECVFSAKLSDAVPAKRIDLANPGGRLELRLANRHGMAAPEHVVWAEPKLARGRVHTLPQEGE